jgi:hypothetical protein
VIVLLLTAGGTMGIVMNSYLTLTHPLACRSLGVGSTIEEVTADF